jgi:hypothetical protein
MTVAKTARQMRRAPSSPPMLPEWADKVWAMKQDTARAVERRPNATYILFTDADIKHHTSNLRGLAVRADANRVDLTPLLGLILSSFTNRSPPPSSARLHGF